MEQTVPQSKIHAKIAKLLEKGCVVTSKVAGRHGFVTKVRTSGVTLRPATGVTKVTRFDVGEAVTLKKGLHPANQEREWVIRNDWETPVDEIPEILFKKELWADVLSKKLTCTIREGTRAYPAYVRILGHYARVTSQRVCRLAWVPINAERAAGFCGWGDMWRGLVSCYPSIRPNDDVTVIRFRILRRLPSK